MIKEAVKTISPSEIISLIDPSTRHSPQSSRKGIATHKQIVAEVLHTGQMLPSRYPPHPKLAEVLSRYPGALDKEVAAQALIGEGVLLRTRIDVVSPGLCLELKPTLKGRHILQTLLGCQAVSISQETDHPDGVLYLYEPRQALLIRASRVGQEVWDGITNLALSAAEIYDLNKREKELQVKKKDAKNAGKKGSPNQPSLGLFIEPAPEEIVPTRLRLEQIKTEMVSRRQEFDTIFDGLKNYLPELIERI